jgi:hypothetical protein
MLNKFFHRLKPFSAIRNRVYTGETRLRGLEIYHLLVHEGGLCLCSREFHSPGLYSSFSVL